MKHRYQQTQVMMWEQVARQAKPFGAHADMDNRVTWFTFLVISLYLAYYFAD